MRCNISERRHEKRSLILIHRRPEIDDPRISQPARHVNAIPIWSHNIGVRPAVGVEWGAQPAASYFARDFKRAGLLDAIERDSGVFRQRHRPCQIGSRRSQIGVYFARGLSVQRQFVRVTGAANDRNSYCRAIDGPRFIGPGVEYDELTDHGVEHASVGSASDAVGCNQPEADTSLGNQSPSCVLKPIANKVGAAGDSSQIGLAECSDVVFRRNPPP